MKTGFKQSGLVRLRSPFGADDLLLDSLTGSEGISELFRFALHMRSPNPGLDGATVLGQPLTVTIDPDGSSPRFISGIVTRFVQSGQDQDFAIYEAELAPDLWRLTLARDRKIHTNMGVDAIVKAVLGEFGIQFESQLAATYPVRDYCVQYDESGFDFISRLMECAGIFYFFSFDSSGHKMVLADANSQCADCSGAAAVRFWPDTGMAHPADAVTRFAHERRLALQTATVDDYDFTTPDTALAGAHAADAGSGSGYEFGAGHASADAGSALAKLRVEAGQAASDVLRGDSYCHPFTAGSKFTLSGHFVAGLNAGYLLRRVQHTLREQRYANTFEALPAGLPFRAPLVTPRPRVAGCETARVLGPSGEEIWTDKHGRVKLHFPWDRDAADDTKAPWVRVAQAVAGNGFGALFLPRVGDEVVITYINGDPDRPLVTGSVYNGSKLPPATLPAGQTQSILRTRSSKDGSAGNELRFEDKKDAEQLYLHAQKDLLAEIENALTTTVKKGAETHTLEEGDRSIDVKKGKETHKVAGTRDLGVTGAETHANQAAFTHTVKGDYALTIDGALTITVKGAIKLAGDGAIALEAGTSFKAKSGTELLCDAGTDLTGKAGKNLNQQAGMKIDSKAAIISSKADATHNVEAGAILTLKGAMAKVN
jgi:type VI secretion system secreted protein VgrG